MRYLGLPVAVGDEHVVQFTRTVDGRMIPMRLAICLPDKKHRTELTGELAEHITHAVTGLRDAGYSWADIAARAGMTRQAAQQRWGGQPQ